MNSASSKESLKTLYKKWGQVQGELKEAEQINQLAVIPAINELRYAGRILVAALAHHSLELNLAKETGDSELDGKSLNDAIVIANQYITNAEHDISDALIYFFQKRADEINGRFGAASVVQRYSEYEEFLTKLKEARRLIIDSRSNIADRHKNYLLIKNITKYLIDKYYILDKSDTFMSIEVEKIERNSLKYRISTYFFAAFSILCILFLVFKQNASM